MMNLKPFKSNAVTLQRETTTMELSNDEVRINEIVLLVAIFEIPISEIPEFL